MINSVGFLPVSMEELTSHGKHYADFVLVTGDAYVDHPSFGAAVIGRVLENLGFTVAVLAQPRYDNCEDFRRFKRPKYAFLVTGGNIDSMVAHYSVAKKKRSIDDYSPGGKIGKRPDRAATVYAKLAKEAFPDVPVILGGLEASLRRMAHYDYWANKVMTSILDSSGADLLVYGMGEHAITEIANAFKSRKTVADMRNIRGVCYALTEGEQVPKESLLLSGIKKITGDPKTYMQTALLQQENTDSITAKTLAQKQNLCIVVQNPPAEPLFGEELDAVYALPYMRLPHPIYDSMGGVKSIEEVRFSIIHNRGCFGGCNFCALVLHQGRRVTARSHESVVAEAEIISKLPDFKGYIHDVGGPTANFRHPSCKKQLTKGVCKHRQCLAPTPCPSLEVDHRDYALLLRKIAALPGVKKVFVRSGIRYDYLMQDGNNEFFNQIVKDHVSGQLKVAPEHTERRPLYHMGKPSVEAFDAFRKKYMRLSKKAGKEQYLVPYLMSSHPGCTRDDAVALHRYLVKNKLHPEQVQDFYPTPGTLSTAMFYTGLCSKSLGKIYVAKSADEKSAQRRLLNNIRKRK